MNKPKGKLIEISMDKAYLFSMIDEGKLSIKDFTCLLEDMKISNETNKKKLIEYSVYLERVERKLKIFTKTIKETIYPDTMNRIMLFYASDFIAKYTESFTLIQDKFKMFFLFSAPAPL